MRTLILVIALSVLSATAATASTDSALSRIENSIQSVFRIEGQEWPKYTIDERLKELSIPGLSVAVVVDGKLAWVKSYGLADVATQKPVTTDTLFLAGSISKPVSALRIHQMSESRIIDLDVNVNAYLKSWQVPENEFTVKEKVTLRRILNHTAGLTVWGFPGYDFGDEVPSAIDVLEGRGNTEPVRVFKTPGESWLYSGGGYTIMQLLIEDLDGQPFEESLGHHVLEKLEMSSSTFQNPLPETLRPLAASGYRIDGSQVEGKWPIYPEMAAAGLWTIPSELIRYAMELQRISEGETGLLLRPDTVAEMLRPGLNGHGLGPVVNEFTFGHGGADEGFRASLVAWKSRPYALVAMVNSDNARILDEFTFAVAREYDLPGYEYEVKSPIVLPSGELKKFAGTYEIAQMGLVTVSAENGGLTTYIERLQIRSHYLAESRDTFFHKDEGHSLKFIVADGEVSGFETRGLSAARIE